MKSQLFALTLISLAACGDNTDTDLTPDAGPVDSGIDAPPAPVRAVVVAGDFNPGSPGVLSVLDLATRTIETNVGPAGAVGEDPILRKFGDELFVVNRSAGNNVTILDAQAFSLVEQLATGAGSNPQDVAVLGTKLYVATFGNKGAVMLTRGSTTITEIDLSVDDPDGKPNCSSIHEADGALYVTCGLLDDGQAFLPPRGPGKVYVVDPTTLAVTRTITLAHPNPFGLLERLPAGAPNAGDLVTMSVDFGNGNAGCVERITRGASAASGGCLVDNAVLGNFASRVDIFAPEFTGPVAPIVTPPILYAVVPKADFSGGEVLGYDLGSATLWPAPVTGAGLAISDLVMCPTGDLVVADAPFAPSTAPAGLRVYRGMTEMTTAPLAVGLTPSSTHGLVCY